jgi:hypothetical protein
VQVKGRLLCGSQPAVGVRVKLVDDDFGPDPDDEIDSGYTDAQGHFVLAGDTTELTTIDPHLKICKSVYRCEFKSQNPEIFISVLFNKYN